MVSYEHGQLNVVFPVTPVSGRAIPAAQASAADGYTESLPLEVALDPETWLAYEMGGAPLTVEHGFPLRVLIAGRYGMKQPKSLTGIGLAAEDEPGFWQRRGWDRDAFVRTMSRIDLPRDGDSVPGGRPLDVYGIASSGDRGIARVEVSSDGGSSWVDADIEPPGAAIGPDDEGALEAGLAAPRLREDGHRGAARAGRVGHRPEGRVEDLLDAQLPLDRARDGGRPRCRTSRRATHRDQGAVQRAVDCEWHAGAPHGALSVCVAERTE